MIINYKGFNELKSCPYEFCIIHECTNSQLTFKNRIDIFIFMIEYESNVSESF